MLSITQQVFHKMAHVTKEGELSIFNKSDKNIIDLIYDTHVHADESFDEDSLFVIVENILQRAIQTSDKVVQGSQVHADNIEENKAPKPNLSVPLCKLKQISSELSCKPPGEKIAHETTLSILNKLSTYSWEAKAVLTLAAFALDYGDFWHLAQLYQSDPLAKQLAILKRVPVLIKPSELQKRRQAVLELNSLINTTMRVIAIFDEFEKLSYLDTKDIPGLFPSLDHLPVDVYWAILTIAACATKLTILISDEPDKPHDLSPYAQKIHFILNNLNLQLTICRRQKEVAEAPRHLHKIMRTPTEIVEIFKALIFIYTKDNVQPLFDGSTKITVNIDVLRRKNVYAFFSGLDISDDDISILKPVYDATKKENQYTILWIPIVEQWTEELKKKFEILRTKMPWYSLQFFSPIAGVRFIKEEWQYKGKPKVVLMNTQGKVENHNVLHLIHSSGMTAFPFDEEAEKRIENEKNWLHSVIMDLHPSIPSMIKEEKYIFFYGGKDNEWIQQFTKKATALANDAFIKDSKINIELICVGKTAKGGEDLGILGRFWNAIEGLFFTKIDKQVDPVSQEIQKLLSYKNESGWVVLSKGSAVVTTGHGSIILKVLEEFDEWKETIREKGFENTFKEYYSRISLVNRPCCRLDVATTAGKVPESMTCPECSQAMETYFSYKCCHVDGLVNSYH